MPPVDLIVIGGGPAGTTLAGLVKKYAPQRRVVLLEKDPGPTHQIGESLLPGIVPVLKELGAFEKIDSAGFPKKLGATYIWGRERTPWDNDFNRIDVRTLRDEPGTLHYAWQVRRSAYDEILLRHAESLGVEVRRGTQACGLLEEGGRVAGLVTEKGGRKQELRAEFVADCSGQSGFLSKYRKIRTYNPSLKNVAAFSYFKGARWKFTYTGHPDKTKIFVCSVGCGWFWVIPIDKDVLSIGLVTTVEHVKKRRIKDLRALYDRELRACKEIWPLLQGAERVRDVEGTGKDFFTRSDWSYLNVAASGPGWLAAGDAAVFVDPILSTGVTLAHECGQRAAYTLLTHWREPGGPLEPALWTAYDQFCREAAAQFLVLALFWYGNDRRAERWWGRAKEIQRAWLPVRLDDKTAFITVTAGLTKHYDALFSLAGAADPCSVADDAESLRREYRALFAGPEPGTDAMDAGSVPRLLAPYRTEVAFLPEPNGGRLRAVKRVRFLKHAPDDPVEDAFNPRRIVLNHHLELLRLIDGRRSVAGIREALASGGAPAWFTQGRDLSFLEELRVQGVLAADAGARARGAGPETAALAA